MGWLVWVVLASTDGGVSGTAWVLRVDRPVGSLGHGGVVERRFTARCESLRVDRDRVRVGETIELVLRDDRLLNPRVTGLYRRDLTVDGRCVASWPTAPTFATSAECVAAAASGFTQRCRGSECEWTPVPWLLGACEAELERSIHLLWIALDTDHSQAMTTLKAVMALADRGGTVWLEGSCAPVKVSPPNAARLVTFSTGDSSGTWSATTRLEPLFRSATFESEFGTTDGGTSWGTGTTRVQLLLGRDAFVMGRRVFFLDQRVCRGGPK